MPPVEQVITDNLDIWTSAVQTKSTAGRGKSKQLELYGIKKLRELILELAVRGLLVPQNSNDEPASELLKKIAEAKAGLLKEKKIRKEKALPPILDGEAPFSLPSGWSWSRLVDICQLITQGPNPKYDGIEDDEYRVIKTKDFYDHIIHYQNADQISGAVFEANSKHRLQTGDVIFGLVGKGSTGKCNIFVEQDDASYIYTRATGLVRLVDATLVSPNYLKTVFISGYGKSKSSDLEDGSTGQIVIKTSLLKEMEFPIPPLEEQHRIVAKVDELMSLCDQLEQQQEASITAHQTLVKTLLDAMTTVSERDGFTIAWARIADHFDTLFTTERSIDQLKQTILQLAVMGKLVPQDPNDEPASELLKKIAAEKMKLVKDGKIKKQKVLPPIEENEKLFELPEGWKYKRLGDLAEIFSGNSFKSEDFNETGGVRVIKIANAGVGKLIETDDFLPEHFFDKYEPFQIYEGDLILALTRPYISTGLKISICPKSFHQSLLNQRVAAIRSNINKSFLYHFMQSFYVLGLYQKRFGNSGLQPNLKMSDVTDLIIPIPPQNEQRRIVDKVDELMVLCDQLKAKLNKAQTTQLQLADSVATLHLSHSQLPEQQGKQKTSKPLTKGFARQVLAAEILCRHNDKKMTQMKLQKLIHLVEHHAQLEEVQGVYQRQAAGPYDNQMMYGLATSLKKQQWFQADGNRQDASYTPLQEAGGHQKYFTYWKDKLPTIDAVLGLLGHAEPDQCEIVATLYAAWNDLLIAQEEVTDERIIFEASDSKRWHRAKAEIDPNKWPAALGWMREKGLVPSGFGQHTVNQIRK